jgi:hypothetical protein
VPGFSGLSLTLLSPTPTPPTQARIDADAEITPDTTPAAVAEVWFSDFERPDRSPTTVATYRDRIESTSSRRSATFGCAS